MAEPSADQAHRRDGDVPRDERAAGQLPAVAVQPAGRAAQDSRHPGPLLPLSDRSRRAQMALGECAAAAAEEMVEALHKPGRDIRVLYLDGAPAGFFDLKPHLPESVELAYFGMMEHATGQGLGRWFLGAAIEAAWSYRPEDVTVQTCTLDHPAALPLYQKLGFSPVGQKQEVVRPMSFDERCAGVMREYFRRRRRNGGDVIAIEPPQRRFSVG